MLAFTAYFVRGLQLVLRTSKRAVIERAEEMGEEDDDIPLTEVNGERGHGSVADHSARQSSTHLSTLGGPEDIIPPPTARNPETIRGTGGPPIESGALETSSAVPSVRQDPPPLSRPQIWANWTSLNIDNLTYLIIFLFVGVPIYYTTGYAMPVQLTLNILAYFAAFSLPPRWKRFLHPVLVSSIITVLGIWVLALAHKQTLDDGLKAYKTNTRYLNLWDGDKGLKKPGAGDLFSTVLDASIVALALPMFQYRGEMKRHV
jgi:LrgB-like family